MIDICDLKTYYSTGFLRRTEVRAVDGVSFRIEKGETLGLVGESGCGKTTLGRSLLRLIEPTGGRVVFDGTDITALSRRDLRRFRPRMQMIFQDAYTSLNPRMRIRESVAEPLKIHGLESRAGIDRRVRDLIEMVGLNEEHLNRRPYELSGGQNQRVALARVLALEPDFIVADEPTSGLDVSVQAQILTLFRDLGREYRTACLYISHDLGVVRAMSDRVAVMLKGRIVEIGPTMDVLDHPCHSYTRLLVAASAGEGGFARPAPCPTPFGLPAMVEVRSGHWVEATAW
jgi:ABC-type oligopeptide transport system ATPase subunit